MEETSEEFTKLKMIMFNLFMMVKSYLKPPCKHEFILDEIGVRDKITNSVDWKCHKCNKVFNVEYGVLIVKYGKII